MEPSGSISSADDGNWLLAAIEAGNLYEIERHFSRLGIQDRERLLNSAQSTTNGWSSLHFAAAYGHADIAQWLLSSGRAQVALLDYEGNTPLHLAASSGHKDLVHHLVPEASFLFRPNENSMMPISFCKDHPGMFEALTSAAASSLTAQGSLHVDARCAENRTILHYAAQFAKDPDFIAKLITDNPGDLQHKDNQGDTFLHVAAKCGNMEVLQALKKLGSARTDVTQLFSVTGCDPLYSPGMYALLYNQREFFDELITIGKVEITLGCIIKGLIAELFDNPDIQRRLGLFASTLPTYLALYAYKDCIFNFLVETKLLSVSQWDDEYKRTCLHWAVVDNRMDIIEKLCQNDQLRPGIQDGDGKTALHHAFERKNHMAMEIMRDKRDFKEHDEKLNRDREVYVQALNAILVCAALIASVTFAGWLQLPSGAEFDSLSLKAFWASNSTSFFTAVATMCVTTTALLPTPNKYVGDIVNQVRVAIVIAAGLLDFSLVAVTVAFAAAGFAAIRHSHNFIYQVIMWVTAGGGGLLCLMMCIAFILQLYRCTPSKSMLFALVLPALPCNLRLNRWWPASIQSIHARIGDSSRFGYPVKKKGELKDFMNRDLVAYHASQQLAHTPRESNRRIPIETMKQQLRNLGIPDIDLFVDTIYDQKQDESVKRQLAELSFNMSSPS